MEEIVKEHEQYVESVRDLNDWLTSAKEELQRWSDMSGDAASVQRKLSKVRVRLSVLYCVLISSCAHSKTRNMYLGSQLSQF